MGDINNPPKINTVGQFLRYDNANYGTMKSIPSVNEFLHIKK